MRIKLVGRRYEVKTIIKVRKEDNMTNKEKERGLALNWKEDDDDESPEMEGPKMVDWKFTEVQIFLLRLALAWKTIRISIYFLKRNKVAIIMVELSSELGERSECVYKSLRTPAQWQLVKGREQPRIT